MNGQDEDLDAKVAIVGLSCRFPGAPDAATFWANLRDGVESMRTIDEDELAAAGVDPAESGDPDYVPVQPDFAGIDLFDAEYFGFSPRQAMTTDPQHRIFLEQAVAALEHAGYGAGAPGSRVGVYGGASTTAYLENITANLDRGESIRGENVGLGFELAFLTSRVAHQLDLRGPTVPVQTACSTSLVAVHLACQALLDLECDMAVAGAVAYKVRPGTGYLYRDGAFLSPDGHVRPFDAAARGTVFGNGAGVLVLKRLADALADGDTVHAVIAGSAVNNDGSDKASFTAPAAAGQAAVIGEAWAAAGTGPEDIDLVEAHGSGTVVGDAIEFQALRRVFDGRGSADLGSVKGNVGHLDAASGMAGLIKTVLAMTHETLPPSVNFDRPSPDVPLAGGPFRIRTEAAPWPRRPDRVRRAGVSAFGFGGTNAHVVLEEAPEPGVVRDAPPVCALRLSARTPEALDELTDRLADHLEHHRPDLADTAHTLAEGRRAHRHRRAVSVPGDDPVAAAAMLRRRGSTEVATGVAGDPRIVFLFTGQGAQRTGMGHELYLGEPVYRDAVDRCAEIVSPLLGTDLLDVLFDPDVDVDDTLHAQPALFATEYALATLLRDRGIAPSAMIGHSLGELVAATVAGVFTLPDALATVVLRARAMHDLPAGSMASVVADRDGLELPDDLALAAHNSVRDCVVSGSPDAVATFTAAARARGTTVAPVAGTRAFHHPSAAPAAETLRAHLAGLALSPPNIPITSTRTGAPLTAEQATDPGYWAEHVLRTVEFHAAVTATTTPSTVYVEVGPGNTLATLVRRGHTGDGDPAVTVTTLPHRRDRRDAAQTLRYALDRLWTLGARVTPPPGGRRIPLPTYPFQRSRHWMDVPADDAPRPRGRGPHPLLDQELLRSAGQTVFGTELSAERHWVLSEHRLLGEALVPGTTYLEMGRAAAELHLGRPVTVLREVEFLVPLMVPDGESRTVHVTVREGQDGHADTEVEFTVASHDPGTGGWTTHVRGLAGSRRQAVPADADLPRMRERCTARKVDTSTVQAGHAVMTFGERWVHSLPVVHVGERAAVGELNLPEGYRAECDTLALHPALLDLATGFTGLALAGAGDAERGFFLPIGYDELRLHRPLPASGVSLIEPRPGTTLDDDVRVSDVLVCDDDGAVAVTVRGFTVRRVPDAARTVARLRPRTRHHELRWVPATGGPGPRRAPGEILVVAEPDSAGTELADELAAAGAAVTLVELTTHTPGTGPSVGGRSLVRASAEGFAELADALREGGPRHLVHVASANPKPVPAHLHVGVHALFQLFRTLSERGVVPTRLDVVAPSVSPVDGHEDGPHSVHAALFGLATVIGAEIGDAEVRCVDAGPGVGAGAVCAELLGERAPVTVALRGTERHVRELVRVDLGERRRPVPPDPAGVHLITGGLGGLGLALAGRLAATVPGVRLALLARDLPDGDDDRSRARQAAVTALTEAGADVRVYAVDVADAARVADAVARVRAEQGRISVVVHAAGVAGDGFLFRKDAATFRATLDAKVLGAVALAEATRHEPPELTVLFSSTVAVFGAAGQGDYTAANAFLDAYAEELTARGRPSVSVAWTDWLGTGMAHDHDVRADQGFFRSIGIEDALDSLEEILTADRARVVVGEVNLARRGDPAIAATLARSPVTLGEPLRRALTGAGDGGADGPATGDGPALTGRDTGYSDTERTLAGIWAAETGLTEIDVHDSGVALGVDSLTGLRIAQQIHKNLRVRVSMADMFRLDTVAELAAHLDAAGARTEGGSDT
ncbi:type I polyketide synthase [Actinophytocola oryzae]|uniref:Epothilone polyketide synthase C n=1 Tax=Actinophytocola oryzae TaxID=502181 RepID=A0A4R7VK04_9PSEU|nr:type I polyketide synthase [Actinophytocola oryzae]TDV49790.1 epothilone polyketide synthase C [Actinophytocola oryzae]